MFIIDNIIMHPVKGTIFIDSIICMIFLLKLYNTNNGDRTYAPDVSIVITDGESTYDKDKTIPYANDAKRAGIKIIAVGITNRVKYFNKM